MNLALASRMLAEAVRDRRYEDTELGPAIQHYLRWKRLSGASERTLDQYERDLARMAVVLAHQPLAEVAAGDLMLVLEQFPPGSWKRARAAMSDFWKHQLRLDEVQRNPMDLLPAFKAPPAKVHDIFTQGEQGAIINAARLSGLSAVNRTRVLLLLDAGARAGEARAMLVEHINLSDKFVVLYGKGGKERLVPLAGPVVQAIDEMLMTDLPKLGRPPKRSDHVWFPARYTGDYGDRRGGLLGVYPHLPMAYSTFWRWWNSLVGVSGVRYRKPHMTRHTYGTELVDQGVNLKDVADLMGHVSTTTTEVYVHSSRKRLERAAGALAKARESRES